MFPIDSHVVYIVQWILFALILFDFLVALDEDEHSLFPESFSFFDFCDSILRSSAHF